jgi:hypothetical protein
MKKRGLASPDLADALALTFALPIGKSNHAAQLTGKADQGHITPDYDPYQQMWNPPS